MKDFIEKYSIATLALLISVLNFYIANLRRFKLKVRDAGRIIVTKDPHKLQNLMIFFRFDI